MENQQKQINIKAKDEDLKGGYSNLVQMYHGKEEFIFDFLFVTPSGGTLSSRVIMSPGHAKRLAKALEGNVKKYEEKFGNIEEAKGTEANANIGF